jgi:hypothetical protein
VHVGHWYSETKAVAPVDRDFAEPRKYVAMSVRIGDALAQLGLDTSDLYPSVDKSGEVRALAALHGCTVDISSRARDAQGQVTADVLRKVDTRCRVAVTLDYAAPDAHPLLDLRSVSVSDHGNRILRVQFRLGCVGKTPLAFAQRQFGVLLSGGSLKRDIYGYDATFPKGTAQVLSVTQSTALIVTMDVAGEFEGSEGRMALSSVPAGEYRLSAVVANNPKKSREFDYECLGRLESASCVIRLR